MEDNRDPTIDALRGFALLAMVVANFTLNLVWIPGWMKHSPDVGFRFIDLGAPGFLFVVGLNYVTSAKRRLERDGSLEMTRHFLMRYLAILGLGSIFGAGQALMRINDVTVNWGVLQAIGMAGLVTLAVIRLGTWWRLAIGLTVLSAYQFLLDRYWLEAVLASPHGGLPGSLSWAGLLILATVLADLYHDQDKNVARLVTASTVCIIAALILSKWFPISKNRVSESYVLLSLGLSGWFFWAFYWLIHGLKMKLAVFTWWGRNPIILYVLHLLLQGLFTLPFGPDWNLAAPPWLVSIQVISLLFILTLVARYLDRKKIIFSI
jgi:predicted acyltransferase